MRRVFLATMLVMFLAPAHAAGQSHLLVVSGLGGEARYTEWFTEWGATLVDAAEESYGMPAANVTFLAERTELDPERIDGRSTKAEIEAAFRALAARSRPGETVVVVLMGHGAVGGAGPRVNLPGPDLTATEWAAQLDRLDGRRVAFVNTASSSGAFLEAVAAPERVVVTATKSGMERNEAVFGRHFAAAFAGDGADTDKDGRVSLLEAFVYARAETAREYEDDNKLLTEHAVLDDDGDGKGAEAFTPDGEGRLASILFLGDPAAARAGADAPPELRAALERKRVLEGQLAELRARRASMDPAAYQAALEDVLVGIAEVDEEIRRLGGGG
ncbi:MAG: hypothetical protein WEA24_00810 [Gemmatimonadota bacterium]